MEVVQEGFTEVESLLLPSKLKVGKKEGVSPEELLAVREKDKEILGQGESELKAVLWAVSDIEGEVEPESLPPVLLVTLGEGEGKLETLPSEEELGLPVEESVSSKGVCEEMGVEEKIAEIVFIPDVETVGVSPNSLGLGTCEMEEDPVVLEVPLLELVVEGEGVCGKEGRELPETSTGVKEELEVVDADEEKEGEDVDVRVLTS